MIYPLLLLCFFSTAGMISSYLAIREKDLLRAIALSAVQSIAFALLYAVLLAPDILLVYLAVGLGIYPIILIYTVKKTRRYEE